MDYSETEPKAAGSSTSGATRGAKTSATGIVETGVEEKKPMAERAREVAEKTSERAGILTDDAGDVISENPWVSTLTVLAVGLVAGVFLGIFLSRD